MFLSSWSLFPKSSCKAFEQQREGVKMGMVVVEVFSGREGMFIRMVVEVVSKGEKRSYHGMWDSRKDRGRVSYFK